MRYFQSKFRTQRLEQFVRCGARPSLYVGPDGERLKWLIARGRRIGGVNVASLTSSSCGASTLHLRDKLLALGSGASSRWNQWTISNIGSGTYTCTGLFRTDILLPPLSLYLSASQLLYMASTVRSTSSIRHDSRHDTSAAVKAGEPVQFLAGGFAGQTIRIEIVELQQAELGRKAGLKGSFPSTTLTLGRGRSTFM
jgi:hypothetical protein